MSKYYIGIDNGCSGSVAIIKPSGNVFLSAMPVRVEQSYTKAKQNISRIHFDKLVELFSEQIPRGSHVRVVMERPLLNPTRFKASVSGLRALEAVLIVVEDIYHYPFSYIDSKEWQKALLPSGLKGPELKEASLQIGNRLFPQFRDFKHKDRDGLLIAEYARRNQL